MNEHGAVILNPKGAGTGPIGAMMINETSVENADIWDALDRQHQPLLAAVGRWAEGTNRGGGLFERDRYVTPRNIYQQMIVAQDAAENDNIVAGVLESTEALAFSRMSIESYDEDEDDIWNQIIRDIDLDTRFREMWRELFICSQFYAVTWWGTKTYKVSRRDMKTGNKKKKVYQNLQVPIAMSLLDPLKVLPVGDMMFNQETLCYIATREEGQLITNFLDENRSDDQVVANLITGKYSNPTLTERRLIGELGIGVDQLFTLNPDFVWRHTSTRPQYQRFADVRLKSVFELLDLKHQLREMDRAHLIGGTNFIILVKKGSDQLPAHPSELENLQGSVRTLARVPVIVGDHRLNIEIITPKLDQTLDKDRHDLLDGKIASRLFQTFVSGSSQRGDDNLKLARVVGKGLESRRYMMKQTFETQILRKVYERNENITEMPSLVFHPNNVALEFDADMANYLLDLRDRGDLSRDTMLNQVDLDQDVEYQKRKREKELGYDKVFETEVPFTAPKSVLKGPATGPGSSSNTGKSGADSPATGPRTAGRTQGGNRNRGGRNPGTSKATEEDEE